MLTSEVEAIKGNIGVLLNVIAIKVFKYFRYISSILTFPSIVSIDKQMVIVKSCNISFKCS